MTIKLGAVFLCWLLVLVPRIAGACSCVQERSDCALYRRAEIAFVGDIVDVNVASNASALTYQIKVLRAGKGGLERGQVVSVRSEGPGSSCSLEAQAGQRWVIYASRTKGALETHKCAGDRRLRDDEPLPDLPPVPGTVTGVLTRWSEDHDDGVGVSGVPVWVDVPGRRIAGRTRRHGYFRLTGIPAGRYTVLFGVERGESAEAEIDLWTKEECTSVAVSIEEGGGIVGRLLDETGAPIVRAKVSLEPAPTVGPPFDWSRSSGEFRMVPISRGTYTILVSDEGPTGAFPYEKTFYPGTDRLSQARTMRVEDGIVQVEPFVLRDRVPVTTLTVEIVCRDGTKPGRGAVTGARVGSSARPDQTDGPDRDGLYRLRVLKLGRVNVEGIVEGRVRAADGTFFSSGQSTAPVEVSADPNPGLVRLTFGASRCDAPGGPVFEDP